MTSGGTTRGCEAGRDPHRASGSGRTELLLLAVAALALSTGCGTPDGTTTATTVDRATVDRESTGAWADATGALPEDAPDRFGFGREADEARVAMWDIDIRPDGAGLPPGSGSVAQGRQVFNTHCIACHGPTGTEGPNDRLVDSELWDQAPTTRTIGNYWPYSTTLYDYIRKAMPQLTPGVLTDGEVYAVIAYLLHLNEIVPEDAVMTAETLPQVVMPARDRFIVDDRVGGAGSVR